MAATSIAVDPITTEVIRSAFSSAADEMNAGLIRSAYTPIIYELKDCSVALLDADHRVLGQSSGLPIFLGNLEICTRLTEEWYGREAWRPGDVWIMNDSYLAGTHLNDVTVFGPIFHDEALVGFAASRAHWLDVGAKDPARPWTPRRSSRRACASGRRGSSRAACPAATCSTCCRATRASRSRCSAICRRRWPACASASSGSAPSSTASACRP